MIRRWARWLGSTLAIVLVVLIAAALITARSGDRNLYPPPPGLPGIEVFVVSHGYHAGIVLPRAPMGDIVGAEGLGALDAVATRFAAFRWLEIGWGDEGFYTSVPTIASLTLPVALRALFLPGNPSVLHVVGLADHPLAAFPNAELVRLELSASGFLKLLTKLNASFAPGPRGSANELGPGLYGPSLFYRANGAFHLFNVCNHWIADLLDAAGVPTTRLVATLPPGLLLDLRWRAGAVPASRGH